MAANIFGRYVWLIDTIRRYKRLTYEDINRLWKRSGLSYGEEDDLPLLTWKEPFRRKTLDYLCDQFEILYDTHHRAGDDAEMCARLFLREIKDAGWLELSEMDYCNGKL